MPQRTPAGIVGRLILPALALAGCGSEPERPIGPDPGPGDSTGVALVFADPALQSAVEAAAETGDAAGLVSLTAREGGIADLTGIEQLTRLEVLDLYGNEIRDLSPLAELTRLRYLDLGSNRVEEVSALASLKRLQVLLLADNALTDVSVLAGLDSLQSVDLTGNPLSASAEARVAALRERGVDVDFGAPDEPGGGGVVLGDLPIVFSSSRRTGGRAVPEVHSLDPQTGVVVNLSEGLATAPFSDGSEPDTTWRYLDGRIVRVRRSEGPAQSPDGMRIAFTSSRDFNSEIYVMDADGGAPRNLTLHEAWDEGPAWSPDGQRIAFTSDRNGDVEEFGGRFNTDIFVMNADGSGVEQVTIADPLSRSASQPAWSPDGSSIAFGRSGGGIYVLELSSREAWNLTDAGWAPSWSPDGRWIAYMRTVEFEESHVWKIPAAGGEPTQLTLGRFFRRSPTWSPDGDRIVFAREDRVEGVAYDLYVIPAEGGPGEPITSDPGRDTDPCWAPF